MFNLKKEAIVPAGFKDGEGTGDGQGCRSFEGSDKAIDGQGLLLKLLALRFIDGEEA